MTPAIAKYMEFFSNRTQGVMKDHALNFVYHILEEHNKQHLVQALLRASCDTEETVQRDALWLLNVLFLDPKYVETILEFGGVEPLILFAFLGPGGSLGASGSAAACSR